MADVVKFVTQEKCNYCKKYVLEGLECVECSLKYHRSCGARVGTSILGENFTCCENREERSVVRSQKPRKTSEKVDKEGIEMDERQLKRIIHDSFKQFLNPVEKKMDEKLGALEKSVQFMSDAFEEQKAKFESLMEETRSLRRENVALTERVQLLESKLDELEVKERACNVIINGVPKQTDPDTNKIATKIILGLNLRLGNDAILETFRIGNKAESPILVKLDNIHTKKEIVKKIRSIKGTTVAKCGLEGKNSKIYINEDLPVNKRMLFKQVRDKKREKNYFAAFCNEGVIFLKRNEQDTPVKIRTEKDIY